jgi:hypothetical protein
MDRPERVRAAKTVPRGAPVRGPHAGLRRTAAG